MLGICNFGITIWRFLQAPRDKFKIQNFTLPINWWYTFANFRKQKNFDQIDYQFEIGFVEEHDIVFNVISKAVLPPLFATEVINHTSIGHAVYQDFISNRFHENIFVWSPMQKCNLKSFKANNKMIKKKLITKLYSCVRRKIY